MTSKSPTASVAAIPGSLLILVFLADVAVQLVEPSRSHRALD